MIIDLDLDLTPEKPAEVSLERFRQNLSSRQGWRSPPKTLLDTDIPGDVDALHRSYLSYVATCYSNHLGLEIDPTTRTATTTARCPAR